MRQKIFGMYSVKPKAAAQYELLFYVLARQALRVIQVGAGAAIPQTLEPYYAKNCFFQFMERCSLVSVKSTQL